MSGPNGHGGVLSFLPDGRGIVGLKYLPISF